MRKKITSNIKNNIVREADENIYLNNDSPQIKEIFKFTINLFDKSFQNNVTDILDVGCANGSFLSALSKTFPSSNLFGMDISQKLLEQASLTVPNAHLIKGSIERKDILQNKKFDLVTMFGVLGLFENPQIAIENSISYLKKNGRLYISSNFNENDIDVIMKYKRANITKSTWEYGWNIFSVYTIKKILLDIPEVDKFVFYDFTMPFDIKKSDDPMRAWTERVGDKERYQINGAEQLLNRKILEIKVKRN